MRCSPQCLRGRGDAPRRVFWRVGREPGRRSVAAHGARRVTAVRGYGGPPWGKKTRVAANGVNAATRPALQHARSVFLLRRGGRFLFFFAARFAKLARTHARTHGRPTTDDATCGPPAWLAGRLQQGRTRSSVRSPLKNEAGPFPCDPYRHALARRPPRKGPAFFVP